MRISSNIVQQYNFCSNKNFNQNITPSQKTLNSEAPSFKGKKLATISSCLMPFPLHKLKQFNLEEYNRLNSVDKSILRAQYKCLIPPFNKDFYKDVEIIHNQVSDFMKADFDKKYGEGKYVVIPIGRSLSSISKVLGYKIGEENVKNIPLSNTPRFNKIGAFDELCDDSLIRFKEYLSKIGLSRDEIKNSDKTYILTDFCATGQSLLGAKNLFKSERMFGDLPNIVSEDINQTIPTKNWDFRLKLRAHLLESRFKQFSFVKKCENLEDCADSSVKPAKAPFDVKLVWFKLLDNTVRGKKTSLSDLSEHSFFY